MVFVPRVLYLLLLTGALAAPAEETTRFRQWIAGQEAGGSSRHWSRTTAGEQEESHEWTHLERMGTVIEQELKETAVKAPDGSLHFSWTLSLSQEPLQGEANWSPAEPNQLRLTFKNGPARSLEVPAGVTLWPGDQDAQLKAAAKARRPVQLRGYALATQQWTLLDLTPVGPEPLPGFADTVHFRGQASEGNLAETVELWISPSQGEIKHQGAMAGITLVSQRAELPAPLAAGEAGLFERTVKTLAPHPFLLWLETVPVRWDGQGLQNLADDAQQRRTGRNQYHLTRALPPSPAAAAEPPVKGRPSAEDAPYLAPTPLVQFNDPVFDGLEKRLAAPAGASRWDLAQRVNDFVYDWIKDKNYTVGFASAQEVARTPRGDCTEHGVLAVALLRRLGVPARGVTGWVAFGEAMGLHFWVEVRIGGRWIPLDPTFAQAPASAYRLKLGSTDLADLGSVGWESAAMSFLEGGWSPVGPWAEDVRPQGDTALVPGGVALRVPGARWRYAAGRLQLTWGNGHQVEAVPRPATAQLTGAHRLQGARNGRQGWWDPQASQLWADLGSGRWLQVATVTESQAHQLLDLLEVSGAARAEAAA